MAPIIITDMHCCIVGAATAVCTLDRYIDYRGNYHYRHATTMIHDTDIKQGLLITSWPPPAIIAMSCIYRCKTTLSTECSSYKKAPRQPMGAEEWKSPSREHHSSLRYQQSPKASYLLVVQYVQHIVQPEVVEFLYQSTVVIPGQ